VPRGWTGTERSSARWNDSFTSRERKPWILRNLPRFRELPTLSFRSRSIHVADSASHFRGPSRSRSITHPTPGQALSGSPRTAILYASVQSTNFRQLHSHLLRLSGAPTPRVRYIFRPIPVDGVVGGKGYMSGYGVTLDLKKMDYLALDDRRSNSRSTSSCCSPQRFSSDARPSDRTR